MRKLIIALVVLTMTFCTVFSPSVTAGVVTEEVSPLELINQKIALEMQADVMGEEEYNRALTAIDNKLDSAGVELMTANDLNNFILHMENPEDAQMLLEQIPDNKNNELQVTSDGPPCPESTDEIRFYWFRTQIDGEWVYSVIAAPEPNSAHSCNTVSKYVDFKSKLSGTLKSLVQIYADKLIGGLLAYVPVVSWLPYEVFTDLGLDGENSNQLELYEARLITRTVHQFIYVKNSANQYAYYGSANCVHVNVEEIARKYEGSVLVTDTHNAYELVLSEDYYEWPEVCTNGNLTGYNVYVQHSFVNEISVTVAGKNALSTDVVTATLPIHVAQ